MAKNIHIRQLSPEIPSPVKITESICIDDADNIENKIPTGDIEAKDATSSMNSDDNHIDINPMTIILANGQPLLTNFEEKHLIDTILKISNKDIETMLQEKIHFILQMNYGLPSSSFTLNQHWMYDFILKHFQTLVDHANSSELFDKLLNRNFDKNNSTISFKHWQLKTLYDEHKKKQQQQQQQQSTVSQKRRMTVRRIDFN
ncbi:unnamed protein product [Rotaria socialis]|uniref:Uncharacterized protein n=1 Tax=Rotaria socialis TaxID=392032 RepID=A0A820FS47_9BILA|nr:unnamed protein product [Rotaria socialis]CAF3305511.1 unnamed protein product [Rotaria socialis]CAF3310583.1 unnamed protein product [Rotaria socialis]CAF3687007.1 unnamed protein product [Rotaria socialis]CAF4269003.1 unnamed protein product [Rotaria socialis]